MIMKKSIVSVIILNFNGMKNNFLPNCLQSLVQQTYHYLQIIVVDNASSDESVFYVEQNFPDVLLIKNGVNLGFCRGNNIGYHHATGEFILFLNNDTILMPDSIEKLVLAINLHPLIGMVSPKLLRPQLKNTNFHVLDSAGLMLRNDFTLRDRGFGEYDTGQFDESQHIFAPCGAAAFYKRDTLESIQEDGQVWDENFEAYYEDGDLAWRAHRRGWKCVYYPSAVVVHHRGGSSSHNFFSKPMQFKVHTIKNRYLLISKNASLKHIILHSPWLFCRELLIWGYLFLNPRLMIKVINSFRNTVLPTLCKRRGLNKTPKIIDKEHAIFSPESCLFKAKYSMDKKIKVLEVLEATVGGTRKHLVSLLQEIDRGKFDVQVAAPEVRHDNVKDTNFTNAVKALGIPIHFIDMCRGINPPADLISLIKLYVLIRQEKYTLVHTHSSKAGFLGRIAAKLNGVPTIYTPHGFYFLDAGSPLKRNIFLWLEKFAGLFTDKLIAVSHGERETTLKNNIVGEDCCVVIPNAIDPVSFTPDPIARERMRAELGFTNKTLIIGTVSRYISQKDPFTLVRTAKLVLDVLPGTRFVWCGEGEMREATEAFARDLGVHNAFSFLGFRQDVKDIMNTFDIFLLSSIFEGLPYTLLEAMALGIPIVATDVVGSRDVIINGENGILVPSKSPTQLAEALIDLLNDPEKRQKMGDKGKSLLHEQYSLKKMVFDTEAVYDELVAKL